MQWVFLALGSAMLNALSSVTEKKTLFKEHAMEYATVISLFMFVLSLPLLVIADFSGITQQQWLLMFLISLLDAVAFLYITKAVRHMELSESSPLFVYGPAITAVLAFFFIGEMLTARQVAGILSVTLGAYVLELKHMKSREAEILRPFKVMLQSKYIHYLFFGLVLYAVAAVMARFILNTNNPDAVDPYALLIVTHFLVAAIYLIMLHRYHDGFKGIKHGIHNAGKLIILAAIFLFASRVFLTVALAIPAAEVALILGVRRLSSLFSTVLGGELYHDKNLSQKIFACIIMIFGALLITL